MTIDPRALVAEVRKAAAENPDKAFTPGTACRYFDLTEGTPVCIVGTALAALGITSDVLDYRLNDTNIQTIMSAPMNFGIRFRPEADDYDYDCIASWLSYVQRHQDDGNTWGDSVKAADAKWALPEGV